MATFAEMEQFLNQKAGGIGQDEGKTLDDIIQKKKVPLEGFEPRLVHDATIKLDKLL